MFRLVAVAALFLHSGAFASIDIKKIEADLKGAGLKGHIHGAAHDLRQYVFFYRDPNDFFSHEAFSMIPTTPAARAALKEVERHDLVLLRGEIATNPSAQKHLLISDIQIVDAYDSGINVAKHTRQAKFPDDLRATKSFVGMVHAVAAGGEILVMEYKDAVIPVFVSEKAHSKNLFRGDKVRIHYTLQSNPRAPVHLNLDPAVSKPIEVIDSIAQQNGKALTLEGQLVFFPKSPQLLFGVYAIQVTDADGLKRNHTLVNFDDMQVFTEIRRKLEKIWNAKSASIEDGRNCFVNPQIKIRAVGKGHVVSPEQANPQILLDGPDAVNEI